jgi:flagellar protein FliS
MTVEKKQEFTLKITQANKTQMITIIYEIAICYLEEALKCMAEGRRNEAVASLDHAQGCIDELIHSLNLEYELARNLKGIYLFSKKELMAAGAAGNTGRIERVLGDFRLLHEA